MTTHDTHPDNIGQPRRALARTGLKHAIGTLGRWRERSAERNRARLVSDRNRRMLAQWLRRTAETALDPDPIRRRRDVLLHYRAAAVRTDLFEIAALLEHAYNADPISVKALRGLLADGANSPLYNAKIPFAELESTLNYVRSGL